TVTDSDRVWSTFANALSVGEITEGAPVRLAVPGVPEFEGAVDFLTAPHFVGAHTPDALVMLLRGYQDSLFVQYHGFSDDQDEKEIETAFQSWLGEAFV